MRILLIDDDKQYQNWFQNEISNDFVVETLDTPDINAIEDTIRKDDFSAILIDLHLPQLDGISLWTKLSGSTRNKIPGFIISESFDSKYRELALSYGINDYLHKNMSKKEILLRIYNWVNRKPEINSIKEVYGLKIDEENFLVEFEEQTVTLTRTEFRILKNLIGDNNLDIPRTKFMSKIWPDRNVVKQTLNTHIFNLNEKLNFWPWLIVVKDDTIQIVQRCK
ncbi:MAG: response regulator transcription factor [Bdellovibrionales bacterium]|nr:response regulator transcription factor [Bdellovibrionales bacterium]